MNHPTTVTDSRRNEGLLRLSSGLAFLTLIALTLSASPAGAQVPLVFLNGWSNALEYGPPAPALGAALLEKSSALAPAPRSLATVFQEDMEDADVDAPDQPEDATPGFEREASQLRLGGGLTFDPVMYMQTAGVEVFIRDRIGIGPLVQLGLSDDETFFAPALVVSWYSHLLDDENLRLLAQAGVGVGYLEKDDRPGDDNDVEFMLTTGVGVNYQVRSDVSLGTELLANFFPGELVGEDVIVGLQIISVRIHF